MGADYLILYMAEIIKGPWKGEPTLDDRLQKEYEEYLGLMERRAARIVDVQRRLASGDLPPNVAIAVATPVDSYEVWSEQRKLELERKAEDARRMDIGAAEDLLKRNGEAQAAIVASDDELRKTYEHQKGTFAWRDGKWPSFEAWKAKYIAEQQRTAGRFTEECLVEVRSKLEALRDIPPVLGKPTNPARRKEPWWKIW